MKSNVVTESLGFFLKSFWLSSVAALAVLFAGIASASLPLVIASGIIAYGRPLFLLAVRDIKDRSNASVKAAPKRPASIRPSFAGTR